MEYSSEERRAKLNQLIAEDEDASRLEQEFWEEKRKYEGLVDKLPRFLRDRLYGYPAMCYHYHQRIISLLCRNLRFPEEE